MATVTEYFQGESGKNYYFKPNPISETPAWGSDVVTLTAGVAGSFSFSRNSEISGVIFERAGASPANTDEVVWVLSISQSGDNTQLIYSTKDTFTNANGTTLASHNSEINFSGTPWTRFHSGGTLEIQSNEVKLPADVFGLPFTQYTRDAASENFIVRIRQTSQNANPIYFWFRVADDKTCYGIQADQAGFSSYINLVYFDGSALQTIATYNPGNLISNTFYWYQIHVVGSAVRIFVEGFSNQLRAEMDNNLTETRIALGNQRALHRIDAIEVIPLPPGAAGFDISTRLVLLEKACDILATVPPSAIADLREFVVDGLALESTSQLIEDQTSQLTFTDGKVDANIDSTSTGLYELNLFAYTGSNVGVLGCTFNIAGTGILARTNILGDATINLDPGTYTVKVLPPTGFASYPDFEVEITNVNINLDIELDPINILLASPAGTCRVYTYVIDGQGNPIQGVLLKATLLDLNTTTNSVTVSTKPVQALSDETGYVGVDLIQGGQIVLGNKKYRIELFDLNKKLIYRIDAIVPNQDSFNLKDFVNA